MVISYEYPDPNYDHVAKKFFTLDLLAATDWSKDAINDTLVKMYNIQQSRE